MEKLIESLKTNQIPRFILELKSLFNSISVKELEDVKKHEGYYRSIIYTTLKIIGIEVDCDVPTNHGVIDITIKTKNYIYVLEFKMGKAEKAIEQIKECKYYEPYLSDPRKVILLGIGFDEKARNIGDYLTEEMES